MPWFVVLLHNPYILPWCRGISDTARCGARRCCRWGARGDSRPPRRSPWCGAGAHPRRRERPARNRRAWGISRRAFALAEMGEMQINPRSAPQALQNDGSVTVLEATSRKFRLYWCPTQAATSQGGCRLPLSKYFRLRGAHARGLSGHHCPSTRRTICSFETGTSCDERHVSCRPSPTRCWALHARAWARSPRLSPRRAGACPERLLRAAGGVLAGVGRLSLRATRCSLMAAAALPGVGPAGCGR